MQQSSKGRDVPHIRKEKRKEKKFHVPNSYPPSNSASLINVYLPLWLETYSVSVVQIGANVILNSRVIQFCTSSVLVSSVLNPQQPYLLPYRIHLLLQFLPLMNTPCTSHASCSLLTDPGLALPVSSLASLVDPWRSYYVGGRFLNRLVLWVYLDKSALLQDTTKAPEKEIILAECHIDLLWSETKRGIYLVHDIF